MCVADRSRWGWWVGGVVVVVVAVVVRVGMWWLQARSGAVQPGDPEEYYRSALYVMQGGYYDTGKWLRPPLYPVFLALLFAVGGVDAARALLWQAVLMGVGSLGFVVLGQQVFGRRDVALVCGVMAALFVPLITFGSLMFAEALFVLLMVLGLAALDRVLQDGGVGVSLGCGVLLGLATLTRAMSLLFIVVAAVVVAMWGGCAGRAQGVGVRLPLFVVSGWRRRVWLAVVLVVGAALVIGPWAVRNYAVYGRLVLVDTNGGISMWYGTVQSEAEQREGEARLAAVSNLADRQSLAVRMALDKVVADPLWFVGRMRFKVVSLLLLQVRSFAVGDVMTVSPQDAVVVQGSGENPFWLTLIADGEYVVVVVLAIFGLVFAPTGRRRVPTVLWVVFGVALSAITIGHPRLRLPLVASVFPYSAYGLLEFPVFWRVRSRRVVLALGGCVVFFALIFSMRYVTWLGGERFAWLGRGALGRGALGEAQGFFVRARAADPTNALRAIDLGDVAFAGGEDAVASAWYARGLALEDRSVYAHAMRIQAAVRLGRVDEARAELAAIAGYGRDTNDLYGWAWGVFTTPPPMQVVPGDVLALGHFTGFAPATFDLARGRWTLGAAQVRLAGGCGVVTLRVRGPVGRRVMLDVFGGALQETMVLDGSVQVWRVSLAGVPGCGQRPTVVGIRSDTGLLDVDRAPWAVGVAVFDVRYDAL